MKHALDCRDERQWHSRAARSEELRRAGAGAGGGLPAAPSSPVVTTTAPTRYPRPLNPATDMTKRHLGNRYELIHEPTWSKNALRRRKRNARDEAKEAEGPRALRCRADAG